MIKALKKKYALSDQGAKDLLKGIVYSVLANISLMFPVILLAIVLNQLLAPVLGASAPEISAAVYTVIGIVILAVVFIFHYCQYTATYLGTYDESARRRIGLAEKLRTLPLTFFHQRDLADLTSTIMGDCANFEHAFSHTVPQFFGAVISTGIVCIGLLIFNWQMGLALLWVAPISFAIVILSRKWQEKLSKKHMNARLELAEGIQECLETVQDIKACNQEEDYLRKLDAKMDAAEKAQISSEMTTASLLTTGQMFLRLGLATVIVVGNSLVVSGDTSLFTYILFLIAASRLYDPLSGAMSNMAELFSVQLQVNRLKEIEEYPEETGEKNIHTNGYDITFDHVQFSYEKGKPVLRDVSFTAKQGQVTALVGPSGGGKSTVAKLAAKFYPLDGGRILLGGTDIAPLNSTMLMKNFSIVFQDVVLFNNTIMENIRVGKKDATDEEVIAAAKAAQCDEFISKLSDGYQTVIGENGSTLSGGECQRLSIARALLKDAPVILLDEATASLDVDNETEIQNAISRLVKGKTVLIIARRLELSLKYSKAMQTKRLAANDMSFEWELRDNEIEFNDMVLQEAISALHCLKQMPEMGRVWYHLLQMKYFDVRPYKMSDDAIITALQEAGLFSDISKTTFYRYQKSAIRMYGEILWGSLDKNSSVYKKFVKMIHSHDLEKQI